MFSYTLELPVVKIKVAVEKISFQYFTLAKLLTRLLTTDLSRTVFSGVFGTLVTILLKTNFSDGFFGSGLMKIWARSTAFVGASYLVFLVEDTSFESDSFSLLRLFTGTCF